MDNTPLETEIPEPLSGKILPSHRRVFRNNPCRVRTKWSLARLKRDLTEQAEFALVKSNGDKSTAKLDNVKSEPSEGLVEQAGQHVSLHCSIQRSIFYRSFLTEACMAQLRPSSVWHYLFSRAPDELSSPHTVSLREESSRSCHSVETLCLPRPALEENKLDL